MCINAVELRNYSIIMYVAVVTGNDMDILKKEYQDLDKLLIPACKVELTTLLGEGMYTYVHVHIYIMEICL